jgi:HAD superfamily hydrolase (TIGR01509 family)
MRSTTSLPDHTGAVSGTNPVPALELRAVLWDMDGTLVDTEPYWIAAEFALVEAHGGSWSHDQAMKLVGQSLQFSAGVLQQAGVDMDKRAIIDHLTREVIGNVRRQVPWRPGARELLHDLFEQNVRCAMVTMSEAPLAREIVAALPEAYFEFLITGDQVQQGKPHPEPYLTAVERLREKDTDLTLHHCVALEDSAPGVASAQAADVVTVAIPHTVQLPEHPGRTTWSTLAGRSTEDLRALVAERATARSLQTPGADDAGADLKGADDAATGEAAAEDVAAAAGGRR